MSQPGLHVSPSGEAKCLRGPPGRAARRKKASARVLAKSPTSPLGSEAANHKPGTAVCKVFHEQLTTNHCLYGSPAARHSFQERTRPRKWFSRITNHESRLLWFSRITKHETRITAFTFFTKHEPQGFPRPDLNASRLGATATPPASVLGSRITRHESRITVFQVPPYSRR